MQINKMGISGYFWTRTQMAEFADDVIRMTVALAFNMRHIVKRSHDVMQTSARFGFVVVLKIIQFETASSRTNDA